MPPLILAMAGGAMGAGLRYLAGRAAFHLFGPGYPWGTLGVNLIGALAMGMLAGWLARFGSGGEAWRVLIGVGILGGFTTFSAFSLEAFLMIERGQWAMATGYALISVIGSIAALGAGLALMRGAVA